MKPNFIFIGLVAAAGTGILAALLVAAELHGRHRRDREALQEAGMP